MKHANQRTNYAALKTRSPYETKLSGSHVVEKLLDGKWTPMAHGNSKTVEEDQRLIRCAEACGGEVRIVRRKDNAIVFSRKSSQELSAVDAEESER